jgi:hypothetical protein
MEINELFEAIRVLQEAVLNLIERITRVEETLARQNQTLNIVPLQNIVTDVGGE